MWSWRTVFEVLGAAMLVAVTWQASKAYYCGMK